MAELKAVPDGYHSVQAYLIFQNTVEAMAFYALAFGATERLCMKGPGGKIGHAEIVVGDSCVMMADENPQFEAFGTAHYGGSPVSLLFYTADCDGVYRRAIDAGGVSVREPADQPYGDRMAGIKDPFGYTWYIAQHIKDLSKEELEGNG